MTRAEKIEQIQGVLEVENPLKNMFTNLLETMGDLKYNYRDYMITEPLDCYEELKRVSDADYELCTALLSMVLREKYFSSEFLDRRLAEEQVFPILIRMRDILRTGV